MYEIDYSNMIVRVRVSDSARPPACPKQVFPHTSPPEARNSKKVERSNWLDTQIRCLIDYCIYTFSFFFFTENELPRQNEYVCLHFALNNCDIMLSVQTYQGFPLLYFQGTHNQSPTFCGYGNCHWTYIGR